MGTVLCQGTGKRGALEMEKIAVSVIVPIYNVAPWLEDCLTSLEKQTLKNIEVILVNDGSTDGSREIAARYAQRNGNFTLVDRENGGLSAARNTGLDRARGEYVYFLDSDDYLSENALEILYTKASGENLDVLKFSAYTFTDGCEDVQWTDEYRYSGNYPEVMLGTDALAKFFEYSDVSPSSCLIFTRRETIENNALRFCEGIIHEDNLFHYQLMMVSQRTAVCNQPLYYRRVRAGSIMSAPNWRKRHSSWCTIVKETDAFLGEHWTERANDRYLISFIYMMLDNWDAMPPEMKTSAEIREYLKVIEPILKKHHYAGRRDVRLYCLSPALYKIYRWSVKTARSVLHRQKTKL